MATATAPKAKNIGRITQIIGSTFDVEFEEESLPAIYNAVKITSEHKGVKINLTGEVQQHLGGGRVRCVALGSTDGLIRGQDCLDTGGPVKVPVGKATLGRVFNITGDPVDHRSDQFSIGVVFYELLSYVEPFSGDTLPMITHRIVSQEPTPLEQLVPDASPDLQPAPGPTPRQRRRPSRKPDTATAVVRLRARHPDMTAQDIARRLGVTDRTVRRHLNNHPAVTAA